MNFANITPVGAKFGVNYLGENGLNVKKHYLCSGAMVAPSI